MKVKWRVRHACRNTGALREKCGHAFAPVLERKGRVEQAFLEIEPGGQRHLGGAIDGFLQQDQCRKRVGRNLLGVRDRVRDDVGVGDHLRDEACVVRLSCRDDAGAEAPVHRAHPADPARQALRAAEPGDRAERQFRLPEAGGFARDDCIAGLREFAPASGRIARHRGDDGLAHAPDAFPGSGEKAFANHVRRAALDHGGDVRAGREELRMPRNDDHADFVVAIEVRQVGGQRRHQFNIEYVRLLGPVELQMGNPTDPFRDDEHLLHVVHVHLRCRWIGLSSRTRSAR